VAPESSIPGARHVSPRFAVVSGRRRPRSGHILHGSISSARAFQIRVDARNLQRHTGLPAIPLHYFPVRAAKALGRTRSRSSTERGERRSDSISGPRTSPASSQAPWIHAQNRRRWAVGTRRIAVHLNGSRAGLVDHDIFPERSNGHVRGRRAEIAGASMCRTKPSAHLLRGSDATVLNGKLLERFQRWSRSYDPFGRVAMELATPVLSNVPIPFRLK
jgi:hypothetical protein